MLQIKISKNTNKRIPCFTNVETDLKLESNFFLMPSENGGHKKATGNMYM